jgi:hypothetical protein
MLRAALGERYTEAIVELAAYLCVSFGHETRIDYGTGHETNFVIFLCKYPTHFLSDCTLFARIASPSGRSADCLFRLNVLAREDLKAAVLRVFVAYLKVMRKLQVG